MNPDEKTGVEASVKNTARAEKAEKVFLLENVTDLEHVVHYVDQIIKQRMIDGKNTNATVIALSGDLGAGKTTFTKSLAKSFDIKDVLTSPTFVILKRYTPEPEYVSGRVDDAVRVLQSQSRPQSQMLIENFIHIDAYRLKNEDELRRLSFDSLYQNNKNLICIEWPEMVAGLIPTDAIWIKLEHQEGEGRKVTVS